VLVIKFKGFIINGQPRIPVLVEVPAFRKSKIVSFLVDTGSNFSAISEKEAESMSLDCSMLPEAKKEAVGFGGAFRMRIINSTVYLTFGSDEQKHRIAYSSGFSVVCVQPEKTSEEREKLLRFTPCVLGMDVLSNFEVHIYKNRVELILPK
jgi:hypothetical protein